ncbi:glycosyltransferase [Bosea sp. 117]|uniref:glycosyltransferase n=1 Tax=Bosea sp. 117 TaxID=1125973 RepID=UPI00068C6769|nr:glycosyltransferase [Bosea sp. 117]
MAYRRGSIEVMWDALPGRLGANRSDTASAPYPAEIAGLAGYIDHETLLYAMRRARRLGVGADEVLLASGLVSSDELLTASARHLGIGIDLLDGYATGLALSQADPRATIACGTIRRHDGQLTQAARGLPLRRLAEQLKAQPGLARWVRLTSPERLAARIREMAGERIAEEAAFRLSERQPRLSASSLRLARYLLPVLGMLLAAAPFAGAALPDFAGLALTLIIAALILAWSVLRFTASTVEPAVHAPARRADGELPVYSIIVPIYREAEVVPRLVAALQRLDYPHEKLQVLMVIEADDAVTREAVQRHARHPSFAMVEVPPVGPRTKPKAMNAALPFVRGELVAVYDAEDMPDPAQLRSAHAVFNGPGGRRIACVQGRLAIDNAADSWITRQFAAEYAGHFDLLLPMLAQCGLPFPLGGTSNHFRTEVLRRLSGWDPFNVTEDADLGVRLARAGWRSTVIASTTEEEAPAGFRAWLYQRTRWYKGWLQTLLVHGRHPLALMRELGAWQAGALGIMIGGGLLTALLHPFFVVALAIDLVAGFRPATATDAVANGIGVAVFVVGYGSAAIFTIASMRRRHLPGLWRVLPLVPIYWLMLSLAAWRALLQLVRAPYRWEKTTHGLARTSRRGLGGLAAEASNHGGTSRRMVPRAPVPAVAGPLRDSDADRPPPRRAGASD